MSWWLVFTRRRCTLENKMVACIIYDNWVNFWKSVIIWKVVHLMVGVKRFFFNLSHFFQWLFFFTFILCVFWKLSPIERPQIIFATFILDPKKETLFHTSLSSDTFSLSFFYSKQKWTPRTLDLFLKREALLHLFFISNLVLFICFFILITLFLLATTHLFLTNLLVSSILSSPLRIWVIISVTFFALKLH